MEKTSEKIEGGTKDILELECPNCGGTIQYNQNERKGVCPYCDCEVMILYDGDKERYKLVPYKEKEVTVTRYVDIPAEKRIQQEISEKKIAGMLLSLIGIFLVSLCFMLVFPDGITDKASNNAYQQQLAEKRKNEEQKRGIAVQKVYDQVTQALCQQNYADIEQGKDQLEQYCDLSIITMPDDAYRYQISYRKATENDMHSLTLTTDYWIDFTDLLQYLTGLTSLTLSKHTADCQELADQIRHLTKFSYDAWLDEEVCQIISESTISELSICEPSADDLNTIAYDSNLKSLSINGYSENSLSFLENMMQLQSLTMINFSLKGDLEILTRLPELQTLNLSCCTFSDVLFHDDYPCLVTLMLEENEMVSFDLEKIASIATLQKLSLRGSTVNTSQIARMASSSITDLNLVGTSADDLSFVPNMPALTTLHFTEKDGMDTSILDSYPNLVVEKLQNNESLEQENI